MTQPASDKGNRPSRPEYIDRHNAAELAGWARRLCTTEEELCTAIDAVGPEIEAVKRYLFVSVMRRGASKK